MWSCLVYILVLILAILVMGVIIQILKMMIGHHFLHHFIWRPRCAKARVGLEKKLYWSLSTTLSRRRHDRLKYSLHRDTK